MKNKFIFDPFSFLRIEINFYPYLFKVFIYELVFLYTSLKTPEFYKRHKGLDNIYRSKFDILVAEKFTCRLFGHKWEWWQLLERSKCSRCLESNSREAKVFEAMAAFGFRNKENEYRKLQIPFWKLAGHKATREEQVKEKYMKARGWDYYDLQRATDRAEGAHHKSGYRDYRDVKNLPNIEYTKTKAP